MSILPRRTRHTEPSDGIPQWLPSSTAVETAARRLGCEPGTGREVLGDLHTQTDHLWPAPARAARPACQILHVSRTATAHEFPQPTVAERLAAIGMVYATRHQAVSS